LKSKIFRCLVVFLPYFPPWSQLNQHFITTRSFRRLLRPRLEVKFTSCKTGFEVTSESASRTAENDADGLLGHPKNAKAGSLFCVKWPLLHPAVLQPSFSPTDGENGPLRWIFFVVSWRDTPLFSETTLHKSSETERHIPKPEVIFRNYVGFRNLFLLYWEINTTGSTHTVQQLHITTWFRVYFGLSNQTSNQ
jgi:hypothetical protein